MAPISRLLLAASLPFLASARLQRLTLDPIDCVSACVETLYYLHYADSGFKYPKHDPEFYPDSCQSDTFLESIAACTNEYCHDKGKIIPGWNSLHEYYCTYRPKSEVNFHHWLALSDKHGPATAMKTIGSKKNITAPVYPVAEDFDIAWDTVVAFDYQYSVLHQSFGWAMYLLAAIAFAVGITHRALAYVSSSYRSSRSSSSMEPNSEKSPPLNRGPLTSTRTQWRRYVSLPMFFGRRKETPWALCTIPTRLQGLFIAVLVFINLLFSFGFINQDVFSGNLYFGTTSMQKWRYIADRTGIISTYNFPLLFALAGRNNILLWLTGWSYSTMNLLHKWVSRMAVIQAVAHSIGYVVLYMRYYGGTSAMVEAMAERWFYMGVVSTMALLVIIPLAILPLRRAAYEIFLILHILLAAVALFGLWFHLKLFGREYVNFCWACVGLWAGDRFLRIVRLILLSTRAMTGKANSTGVMHHEGQMVRLEVETSLKFRPAPGTFYQVYFPRKLNLWENHPFTLASWEEPNKESDTPLKLTFLMGVNQGMTQKLARRIQSSQGEAKLSVLLEGPYGHELPIARFESVVLVAGGSGITAIIPYLWDIRRRAASNGELPLATRRVELIWVAKTSDFVDGVLRKELVDAVTKVGSNLDVKVVIHLTRETAEQWSGRQTPPSPISDSSMMDGKAREVVLSQGDDVGVAATEFKGGIMNAVETTPSSHIINFGRPVMASVLDEVVQDNAGGRLGLLICGPTGMMEDMRRAVVDSYGKYDQLTGDNFEYFEESFAW